MLNAIDAEPMAVGGAKPSERNASSTSEAAIVPRCGSTHGSVSSSEKSILERRSHLCLSQRQPTDDPQTEPLRPSPRPTPPRGRAQATPRSRGLAAGAAGSQSQLQEPEMRCAGVDG